MQNVDSLNALRNAFGKSSKIFHSQLGATIIIGFEWYSKCIVYEFSFFFCSNAKELRMENEYLQKIEVKLKCNDNK